MHRVVESRADADSAKGENKKKDTKDAFTDGAGSLRGGGWGVEAKVGANLG